MRFNPKGTDPAREFDLALLDVDDQRLWLAHPDPDVDVAVMPINANALEDDGIEFGIFRSHQHVLDRAGATNAGLSEGDGAYVLGFPMGLVGGERSYVIVRQGALARVRDWLGGSAKDFLVDVAVFPGNSGGPVVSRPDATAIQGTKQQRAAYLIGVVKSYVPYRDAAVSAQTGLTRVVFEENSGLASVVPMEFVIEVIGAHRDSLGPSPTTEEPSVPPEEPAIPDTPSGITPDNPEPEGPTTRKRRRRRTKGARR